MMSFPSSDSSVRVRESACILLADDDPDDRMMTSRALLQHRPGDDVQTVADGEELMDYLLRRSPYDVVSAPQPRLILLDLNMPRKDGREALREIKSDPELRSIPVVVLTTSKAEQDIIESYDLGVNAFVTKPVAFGDLVNAMQTIGEFWFGVVQLPQDN